MTTQWVYVKYMEGSFLDKREMIKTDKVNHDFKKKPFNKRTKYYACDPSGVTVKTQILFIADTKETLEKKIANASRQDLAVKPVDTTSEVDDPPGVSGKNNDDESLSAKKKLKDKEKYAKLLLMEYEKLNEIQNEPKKQAASTEIGLEKIRKRKSPNLPVETPAKITKAIVHTPSTSNLSLVSAEVPQPSISLIIKNTVDKTSKPETVTKTAVSTLPLSHLDLPVSTLEASKVESKKNRGNHSAVDEINNPNKQKSVNKLESKIRKLEKDGKKIEVFQKRIAELENENKKYIELNIKLQEKVLDRFEEQFVIEKQIQDACSNSAGSTMSHDLNYPPIGFEYKSDGMIHIGRGKKLNSEIYSNLLRKSKTPYQCVSNVVRSLFKEDVLISSTVTGRPSNRTIGLTMKKEKTPDAASSVKSAPNVLDPATLLKCKDFYDHWLQTEYPKKLSKEDLKTYDFTILSNKFDAFVSKTIGYLKRPQSKGKQKKKVDDDEDQHENEDVKEQCSEDNEAADFVDVNEDKSNMEIDSDELETDKEDENMDPLALQSFSPVNSEPDNNTRASEGENE